MHAKKCKNTKLIALLAALMLLIGGAVGGTLAWLISQSNTVANTFTVGKISLNLTEPNFVSNDIGRINGEEVAAYKALPGDEIPKDPTVTVAEGSEPCYVRLFMVIWWEDVTDGYFRAMDSDDWFCQYSGDVSFAPGYFTQDDSCIRLYDQTTDQVLGIVQEFRYSTVVDASESDQILRPPFGSIRVPVNLDQDQYQSLDNFRLVLFAQAVQAEGFADANAAFEKAGLPDPTLEVCGGNSFQQIVATLQNQGKSDSGLDE